ncbi:hypothetical protein [[Mycoplasma] mobile]|uniref:Uncharacterized protein n=1 Tax=Mycoplasma mobile (strain ATCC 43663 / 163K / NCTC 11711) TaxID=267748 RepID=Q6KII4_MYCM1|nr:hypothetical protein [[Mycoplasma] mobile]AAT27592.1 hypothetical protein MMOB1060 [Mycoplasma mobile 163K]
MLEILINNKDIYTIKYLSESIEIGKDDILNEEEIINFLVKITKMNGDKYLEIKEKNVEIEDNVYINIYNLFENFVNNYNEHFKFNKKSDR